MVMRMATSRAVLLLLLHPLAGAS